MKHAASKILRDLCCMVVILALAASIASVTASAVSAGVYIAAATPHYKHPITGVIEDAGGESSSVLGQAMTESATYKQALVEVDSYGNTYITVRLQLMDNIQNPGFKVDDKAVSAALMQEDYTENTADYRMKVNSEDSIIRCNMYVTAMGREVIFYITVSDLKSGSGDFITGVKTESKSSQTQSSGAKKKSSQKPKSAVGNSSKQTQTVSSEASSKRSASSAESTEAQTAPGVVSAVTSQPKTSESESSATASYEAVSNTAVGLQEFDAAGNPVDNSGSVKTGGSGGMPSAVWWSLAGIAAAAAVGFGVWYFFFFKKKPLQKIERTDDMNENDELE